MQYHSNHSPPRNGIGPSLNLADQYRFAIDQSAMVSITSTDGIITYVNELFECTSGYSSEHLIGQRHNILNSGVHSSDFFASLWRTLNEGMIWNGTICNRDRQGKLYWTDLTIIPFASSPSVPAQFLAIGFDASSRKSAEFKAEQKQQLLNKIAAEVPTALFVFTSNNEVPIFFNSKCEELYGFEFTPEGREKFWGAIHSEDISLLKADLMRLHADIRAGSVSHVFRYNHPQKGLRWFENKTSVFTRYDDGTPQEILVLTEDITAEMLNATNERLAKEKHFENLRLQSLARVASGVAHEINNPLAIIVGKLEQLKTQLEPLGLASVQKNLATIEKTSFRIHQVVMNMQSLAEDLMRGPVEITSSKILVNDAIQPLVKKCESLDIFLRIDKVTDIQLSCVASSVTQVIGSLLHNAVEAVERLGDKLPKPKWIEIRAHSVPLGTSGTQEDHSPRTSTAETRWLLIDVCDCGVGVPEDLRTKIMDPFFTTKSGQPGRGLGLSMARAAAHAHGGDLVLLPDEPHTTFRLSLPVKDA